MKKFLIFSIAIFLFAHVAKAYEPPEGIGSPTGTGQGSGTRNHTSQVLTFWGGLPCSNYRALT